MPAPYSFEPARPGWGAAAVPLDGVVPVRPTGSEPPLFLVQEGAGSMAYAHGLAAHVHPGIPVHALAPTSPAEPRLRTVEGMGARLVRMIRAVQPSGPYRVAGWCFGGLLAYEVAGQLLGHDEVVEFVGVMGAPPRGEDAPGEALREYSSRPIPVPVHLFSAQESPGAGGWEALLPGSPIRVVPVPGTPGSRADTPDPEPLGGALSQEVARAAGNRKALPGDDYSPLVTLRFGSEGGIPLFCVPGAGANVVSFLELIGCLDPARPVHGLQPRGLDGERVPHATVPAAAEFYLRAIQAAQPAGPVHLLGHSFGGWVVFEIAHRLRRAGRAVGSLTILDSEVPDEDPACIRERDGREAFLDFVDVFEQAAERPLGIGPGEIGALGETGRLKLLHERLVRLGLLPRRSHSDVMSGPFRTFSACLRATYSPAGIYPDPLRLVLVSDSRYDSDGNCTRFEEAAEGWRRWAPNLAFFVGAGNHMTALKQPHVRDLASHFTTGLPAGV